MVVDEKIVAVGVGRSTVSGGGSGVGVVTQLAMIVVIAAIETPKTKARHFSLPASSFSSLRRTFPEGENSIN